MSDTVSPNELLLAHLPDLYLRTEKILKEVNNYYRENLPTLLELANQISQKTTIINQQIKDMIRGGKIGSWRDIDKVASNLYCDGDVSLSSLVNKYSMIYDHGYESAKRKLKSLQDSITDEERKTLETNLRRTNNLGFANQFSIGALDIRKEILKNQLPMPSMLMDAMRGCKLKTKEGTFELLFELYPSEKTDFDREMARYRPGIH